MASSSKGQRRTFYVGRNDLTMWREMRSYTRLTNAFSKKFENHAHNVAFYAAWHDFVKCHKMHRMSPAMAADVSNRLWSMGEVAALADASAPKRSKRKPHKKSSM